MESDDDIGPQTMNGNVNTIFKSTGNWIRSKLLRTINVNVEAKLDHINDDKEEPGVDSEIEKKMFQEANRTGISSDQVEEDDDVEFVEYIRCERYLPYRAHRTIGHLLKNKEKEKSHADALYKQTKSRNERTSSMKMKFFLCQIEIVRSLAESFQVEMSPVWRTLKMKRYLKDLLMEPVTMIIKRST